MSSTLKMDGRFRVMNHNVINHAKASEHKAFSMNFQIKTNYFIFVIKLIFGLKFPTNNELTIKVNMKSEPSAERLLLAA
jgi:hypothetical protein